MVELEMVELLGSLEVLEVMEMDYTEMVVLDLVELFLLEKAQH